MLNADFIIPYQEAESELVINKSRFIAYVRYIESELDVEKQLCAIKEMHKTATHHCYAYVLQKNFKIRFDDDGEPSGTAGKPILEVIQKNNLTNILVVVTRYFGGIKLGAGGLVRAYTKSTALGIEKAGFARQKSYCVFKLDISYDLLRRIENECYKHDFIIENKEFVSCVMLTILVLEEDKEHFIHIIQEISAGQAIIKEIGQKYLKAALA